MLIGVSARRVEKKKHTYTYRVYTARVSNSVMQCSVLLRSLLFFLQRSCTVTAMHTYGWCFTDKTPFQVCTFPGVQYIYILKKNVSAYTLREVITSHRLIIHYNTIYFWNLLLQLYAFAVDVHLEIELTHTPWSL